MMTVSDVANYLKLSDKTVLRLVKHGEIPCAKIANQWRFSTPVLEQWIAGQMILPDAGEGIATSVDRPDEYFGAESLLDLEGESLWAVLGELARDASSRGLIEAADLFLEEQARNGGISSTLLGSGILLLHLCGNASYVKGSGLSFGYSEKGIPVPSLTEQRAKLIVLSLSPDPGKDTSLLKLMGALSDEERVRDLLTRCNRKELYRKLF